MLHVPAIHEQALPTCLSTDNVVSVPPMAGHLRELEAMEIKTISYVPLSHPFAERIVGTLRRECCTRSCPKHFIVTFRSSSSLRRLADYFNSAYSFQAAEAAACFYSYSILACRLGRCGLEPSQVDKDSRVLPRPPVEVWAIYGPSPCFFAMAGASHGRNRMS